MATLCGPGCDRVPDVDVDVEGDVGAGKRTGNGHPHAGVLLRVTDHLGSCLVGREDEPILDVDRGDAPDEDEHGLDVAVDVMGVEIDVPGRPTGLEGGEQHAALADQQIRLRRGGQPGQKPLEGVEGQELVGGLLVAAGLVLQV